MSFSEHLRKFPSNNAIDSTIHKKLTDLIYGNIEVNKKIQLSSIIKTLSNSKYNQMLIFKNEDLEEFKQIFEE